MSNCGSPINDAAASSPVAEAGSVFMTFVTFDGRGSGWYEVDGPAIEAYEFVVAVLRYGRGV